MIIYLEHENEPTFKIAVFENSYDDYLVQLVDNQSLTYQWDSVTSEQVKTIAKSYGFECANPNICKRPFVEYQWVGY